MASLLAALGFAAAATLATVPAGATLGEDVKTVETDRVQTRATLQRSSHAAYTVHLLTLASGTLVREYVSPAGVVFGVTWSGPTLPNIRQLLGDAHFSSFTTSPRRQSGGRGHLAVTEGDLVIESNGRMRSFHGRAYLIGALPAGVTINEIE